MTTNPIPTTTMISSAPMGESTQPRASSTRLRQVDPLRVLRVYARLLIVCAVVGCALGFGVWFGLKQTQPGYTSQAKLSVSPPVTKPFSMAMQDIDANRLDANIFINNEIQRLMSENVMHDALDQEMVRNTGWFKQFYMGPDAKGIVKQLGDTGKIMDGQLSRSTRQTRKP